MKEIVENKKKILHMLKYIIYLGNLAKLITMLHHLNFEE